MVWAGKAQWAVSSCKLLHWSHLWCLRKSQCYSLWQVKTLAQLKTWLNGSYRVSSNWKKDLSRTFLALTRPTLTSFLTHTISTKLSFSLLFHHVKYYVSYFMGVKSLSTSTATLQHPLHLHFPITHSLRSAMVAISIFLNYFLLPKKKRRISMSASLLLIYGANLLLITLEQSFCVSFFFFFNRQRSKFQKMPKSRL